MKINYKKLFICILLPVTLGSLVGFLTSGSNNYMDLMLPSFAPSAILFPIVWTVLYILMGISSYIICVSCSYYKEEAIIVYLLQLIVNLLWSIWFFTLKFYFFSFLWIILLILLVLIMIKRFSKISKISCYLQIPYLCWLIFASILNISVVFLN